MRHIFIIFNIIWVLLLVGCSGHDHEAKGENIIDNERPSLSVTKWTEKMEIFMEYPVMLKSVPGKFVIHFTVLQGFEPVRDGAVTLIFSPQNGADIIVRQEKLLREGIFNPIAELPQVGLYDFTIKYKGPKVSETFKIENFRVYESIQDIPAIQEESDGGISFLKEQQWIIDYQTETVTIQSVRKSIKAVGMVLPRQSLYAEITSPVDGILRVEDNKDMVIPGTLVKKGQILGTISPTLGAVNSWIDLKLGFEHAKAEYERALRLKEKKAISNREFEGIKHNFLIQKAGYEIYAQPGNSNLFQLQAPIDGIVTEIVVLPGQKVNAGEKLMTIIDPSTVWLRAHIFEKDYYQMDILSGASISIPGLNSPIIVKGKNFRLLSLGSVMDSGSRTIPVLLEIDNSKRLLIVGQTVQVDLYTTEGGRGLAIPESALFNDDANQVVFIQISGESFEKRIVKTGNKENGLVSILSGVHKGERVVTAGGYLVKLASTSTAVGHPHAH